MPSKKVSIVVPCYNDERVLKEFYQRTKGVLEKSGLGWEMLFVNDGSADGTWNVISDLCGADARVKGLDLSRNFGHQIAITAGLDHCDGDAVVTLDSDLQDPPELIPELLKLWEQGFDTVYAVHAKRKESFFKTVTARMFYWVWRKFTRLDMPEEAGEYRLMSRRVVEGLKRIQERHRFLRGLAVWTGYKQARIPYERQSSHRDGSGYSLRRMLALALDAIASFSVIPLRIASLLGMFLSMGALLMGFGYLLYWIPYRQPVRGWTSLFVGMSFFSGVQLLLLGVLGEYIGRIYDEVKHRPLYFIQQTMGLGGETARK